MPLFVGTKRAIVATGRVYETETEALAARFTTPPTAARKGLINDLFCALKYSVSGNILAKLDWLHIEAAADEQAAQRNWLADAYNLSPQNSPAFVADRGYTGNGSSSYLNTGFNPTTAVSPKFVQNSGHLGVYVLTNVAEDRDDAGNGNTIIRSRASGNNLNGRVNQGSTSNGPTTTTTSVGHSVIRRPDSANVQAFKNGVQNQTFAVASAAPNNSDFWVCRGGVGGYATKQVAASHCGQTLSDAEILALYNALNVYMGAVGAV